MSKFVVRSKKTGRFLMFQPGSRLDPLCDDVYQACWFDSKEQAEAQGRVRIPNTPFDVVEIDEKTGGPV